MKQEPSGILTLIALLLGGVILTICVWELSKMYEDAYPPVRYRSAPVYDNVPPDQARSPWR
jgi:hypothetical protein